VLIRFTGELVTALAGDLVTVDPILFIVFSPLFGLRIELLGKTASTVSLNISSSILGSKVLSKLLDSSKQGFVFTSIKNMLKSSSNMKSYPKSSKQYL